jgi:hypothetical protein
MLKTFFQELDKKTGEKKKSSPTLQFFCEAMSTFCPYIEKQKEWYLLRIQILELIETFSNLSTYYRTSISLFRTSF